MAFIADILLVAAAIAATFYCIVLSRRLRRFTDLEKGVGGAIAVLSAQVDDMTNTLKSAQSSAVGSAQSLNQLTDRAEGAAKKLELLVAAMHDLPEPPSKPEAPQETAPAAEEPTPVADPEPLAEPAATPDEPEPLFLSRRERAAEAAE